MEAIWSTTPARMRRLRRWHGRWSATQVGTCRTACAENHLLLSQEAHPRVSTRARTRRRWTGLCNPHESIDGPGVCRVTMGWSRPRCRNLAAPGGSRGPSRCHRWRFDPSERPLSRRFPVVGVPDLPVAGASAEPDELRIAGLAVHRKSRDVVLAARGNRSRCSATRLVTPWARSTLPRMIRAPESLPTARCLAQAVDRTNHRHSESERVW
jgi:hypothetical protein